jgi:hypothetical protein
MFIFVLLSADLGSLWGLIKQGFNKCIKKVKEIFKPKKTLAQEQQEYIEQQVSVVLSSLQEMMERHTIIASGMPNMPLVYNETRSEPTIHVAARNVVPAIRVINGDISITYTDAGSIEVVEKKQEEHKKLTHDEIDGWWEE